MCSKKYDLVVTMPDSASIERRKLMRFLGAKVILTPAAEGGTGAYNLAKELVKMIGFLQNNLKTKITQKYMRKQQVMKFIMILKI